MANSFGSSTASLITIFIYDYWILSIAALFVLLLLYVKVSERMLWRSMPPGPPPAPLVGNRSQVPRLKPWVQFREWSKTYGGIYTVFFGQRPTVIISDPQIAVDLMEKRSAKYSSRPRSVAMGELYWDGAAILVQPYGKAWSARRKLLHQALSPPALRKYKALQEAEAARLCTALSQEPVRWEGHIDRFTAGVVFAIAYGRRIDSLDAKIIRQRLSFMQYAASLNVPGRFMVESFPILKYMPRWMAPWKRMIQDKGKLEAQTNIELIERVKLEMTTAADEKKELPASLAKQLLELRANDPAGLGLSYRDFCFVPGSLFGAGSDTTASTLCSGFLALVTHPSVLHCAHAELDAIIGTSRMPTFEDEKDLPYIRALCKEILRWRPVAVLGGTPHASTADDWYEGRYIPKGTTVLGNSWAINMNEEYYKSSEMFEPARFLDTRGEVPEYLQKSKHQQMQPITPDVLASLRPSRAHPSQSGHSSFGWGRRICPGQGLAENSLFIALARLLWTCDILPAKGRSPKDYDTSMDNYTDGFNIRPKKFDCAIRVRGVAQAKVLKAEVEGRAWEVLGKMEVFEE